MFTPGPFGLNDKYIGSLQFLQSQERYDRNQTATSSVWFLFPFLICVKSAQLIDAYDVRKDLQFPDPSFGCRKPDIFRSLENRCPVGSSCSVGYILYIRQTTPKLMSKLRFKRPKLTRAFFRFVCSSRSSRCCPCEPTNIVSSGWSCLSTHLQSNLRERNVIQTEVRFNFAIG